MKYLAKFTGRKVGAIGVTYEIADAVEADDEESARLKLYEKYEHIMGLTLTPLNE